MKFENYLKVNGIKRYLTVPYSPQQNGVAERANRTLVEMARCLLANAGLTELFWADAIHTATYLRNRSLTTALSGITPYEAWFNHKPIVSHLRVFGSRIVALDKTQRSKFQEKGVEQIMIGYSDTAKAYRLYNKENGKFTENRNVIFLDEDLLNMPDYHADIHITEEELSEATVEENSTVKEVAAAEQEPKQKEDNETIGSIEPGEKDIKYGPGRPRILRTGSVGRPKKQYNTLNLIKASQIEIPQTVEEASRCAEWKHWEKAMQEEHDPLIKNKTWTLEKLPENCKAIGSRWVFAIKSNPDDSISRFKARLVAKGCSQKFGIDYLETFSPVVRHATIRFLLSLAAEKNLVLHQMDVVTAYLNSDLTDTVYMQQPEGFISEDFPQHVLKLNKTLYGLKQSGRLWNSKLDGILKKLGFKQTSHDPCLYKGSIATFILIAVYVDDLLLASEDLETLVDIKRRLAFKIDVVDKGEVKYFLGIEIERNMPDNSVPITQKGYIQNLLNRYNMSSCRKASTPVQPGFQVYCGNDKCRRVDVTSYQKIIGELLYLAILTRPDISHSVNKLSQCCKDPHSEHDAAAKHILRYLSETIDYKLIYAKTGKNVEDFVDADWANDELDRRSYTGYAFIFAGAVFSWESRKQHTTALSSTEAEYVALSTAAKEATYLKNLMTDLGVLEINTAIKIH